MSDLYVPTPAGLAAVGMTDAALYASITEDVRGLVDGLRFTADAGTWREVEPEKLHAIADGLEGLLPIESASGARALATLLRRYGLHRL